MQSPSGQLQPLFPQLNDPAPRRLDRWTEVGVFFAFLVGGGWLTSPDEVLSGISTMDPICAVPPPLNMDTFGEPPYSDMVIWNPNILLGDGRA